MGTETRSELDLGIQRIEPVDLENVDVQAAMALTRQAIANPSLQHILEIRTAIQQFLCGELAAKGYVHPPIYMLAGCTDPLNHLTYPARVNYYGEEISVTQSLILQKMLMVMLSPVDKVFWASPNIRMEMKVAEKRYKYTTEFMQVDFEKRDATYGEMLEMLSIMVKGLYAHLNEHHSDALEAVRGELLPEVLGPLAMYDAEETKAAQNLETDDAVERWAATQTDGRPFMVVNLKREAYDCYDAELGKFLNYDVVLPPANKNPNAVECLSGAERTRSIPDLRQRMVDLGYPLEYFAPFFELFSSLDRGNGRIACAGAGFGIERLTYGILGLESVHQAYPFPRLAEAKIAI